MNQVPVPIDHICVHRGRSNSPILTQNDPKYRSFADNFKI